MPANYSIDVVRHLVVSRGWGTLTEEAMLGHARRLAGDPRFRRDMRHLFSFRDVTDARLSSNAVGAVAMANPFGAGAQRAILVGSEVAFGVARMYELLRTPAPDQLQVFRELEPALEWLGLTEAKADVLAQLAAIRESPGTG